MASSRTPEQRDLYNARTRGINQAWERERAYVQLGMGTRDWTEAEQKELLETGRVSGYEAHHMSSVSADPVNASNPDNIQFLTHDEHLAAHGGDYHNPSKGMYDPKTGETKAFAEGEIQAPEAASLSQPACETINTNSVMSDAAVWEYNEAVDAHLSRAERKVNNSEHLTESQKEATIAQMRENAENNKLSFAASIDKAEGKEAAASSDAAGKTAEAGESAEAKSENAETVSSSGPAVGNDSESNDSSESSGNSDDMEL